MRGEPWDSMTTAEKLESLYDHLEQIDRRLADLGGGDQLLFERLRRLETRIETLEKAAGEE